MVTAERERFGRLPDRRAVAAVVLDAGAAGRARVLALGAALQSWDMPDRDGVIANVVLGYPDVAGYLADTAFVGVTVGRFANRIGGGCFDVEEERFALSCNDGGNTLHGGSNGFGRRLWRLLASGAGDDRAFVLFGIVSAHRDQGFPGTLVATARYALDRAGRLTVDYRATTDRATVVSLTNHSYFNLAGAGGGTDVLDHRLAVSGGQVVFVDRSMIPLPGPPASVAATPFDFATPTRVGDRVGAAHPQLGIAGGIDHSYVLDGRAGGVPRRAAWLGDPASGRSLDVATNAPGLQVYTGNHLDRSGFTRHAAIALEPQHLPDAPNRPDFPSPRLEPGSVYRHRIVYTPGIAD